MSSLAFLPAAIASYGYAGLLLAAIVEGPIATVIGAFLASQGLLDPVLVYAVAVTGDLIGDLVYYAIGRWGRSALVVWRPASIERRQRQLALLERRIHANAGSTLLFGKLTHAAGFLVLIAAGAARVRLRTFLGYNLLGTLPKIALFMLLGYFAGAAYARVNVYLGIASLLAFPLVCLAIAAYLRRRLAFDARQA